MKKLFGRKNSNTGNININTQEPRIFQHRCRQCETPLFTMNLLKCDVCDAEYPDLNYVEYSKHLLNGQLDDEARLKSSEVMNTETIRKIQKAAKDREMKLQKSMAEQKEKMQSFLKQCHMHRLTSTWSVEDEVGVIFDNGNPILAHGFDDDKVLRKVGQSFLTIQMVAELMRRISSLEEKFDKFMEMVEFAPGGEEFEEAEQRFEKNLNKRSGGL